MPDKPIHLVELSPDAIHALAAGDLDLANRLAPVALSPYFVGDECIGVWRYRSEQIAGDPAAAGWITRIIVDTGLGVAVGRAGYHGPPDALGLVEIGYSVDPPHRRRGYARAAFVALLERARIEPAVRTVRVSIRPDNKPSRALVLQYGFIEVGEQWDEVDGLEILFEVPA